VAAWYLNRLRIIGVEPDAPTLTNALRAGQPVNSPAGGIAADSLAPKRVGDLLFPIAQSCVKRVVLLRDELIQHAQEVFWRVLRVVTEPGGAAAFAALLSHRCIPQAGERVGVMFAV
jgi:threonine dehydratase